MRSGRIPRQALASSALFAALAFTACTPELRDGWYACPDGVCPEGFSCVAERCVRAASLECFSDANCADDDPCLEVHCVSNVCQRTPVDAPCDDGDFCNGVDRCIDGICMNEPGTIPPCDTCDPTMAMPCACGMLGGSCCGDGSCFEGTCVEGMCETCGTLGNPCCLDTPCVEGGTICDGMSCIACGGPEQRCCRGLGQECDSGLECTGDVCQLPIGCPACTSTETCMDGVCVPCGGNEQPCCGTGCNGGFLCNLSRDRCEPCGGDGGLCCPDEPACRSSDHECASGRCVPCGHMVGAPCCVGAATLSCMPGLFCELGAYCTPCGGTDQRCCFMDLGGDPPCSTAGDDCVMGYCRSGCGGAGEPCCMLRRCGAGLTCNVSSVCA